MKHIQNFNQYETLNEGLGNTISKVVSILLSPVIILIGANFDIKNKCKICKNLLNSYLEKKAERNHLEDARYDIEIPTRMKEVSAKLKELNKVFKKYPTLESYGKKLKNIIKSTNYVNFKNKIDTNWLYEQIDVFCDVDEEEKVETLMRKKQFDFESNKLVNKKEPFIPGL